MDYFIIQKELKAELGREPSDEEVRAEYLSRIECYEALKDEMEAQHEKELNGLLWNGDY